MSNLKIPAVMGETIRMTSLSLLLAGAVSSVWSRDLSAQVAEAATITIELNRSTEIRDPNRPQSKLGTLSAGSEITLTLPSSLAAQLGGRNRLSNLELSEYMNQVAHSSYNASSRDRRTGKSTRSSVQLQTVSIKSAANDSTNPSDATSVVLNLRQLLKSDGVRLNEIRYGPLNREQNRLSSPNSPADLQLKANTTTLESQASCIDCARSRSSALSQAGLESLQASRSELREEANSPRTTQRDDDIKSSIAAYSSGRHVRSLITDATLRKSRTPQRACYHFVKESLYHSGLARRGSLVGNSAFQAATELRHEGFVNLMTDSPYREQYGDLQNHPERAPVGAVIVYAGDSSQNAYRHGDLQIRTPNGYIADYYSPNPMTQQWNGQHFRVIGVMVKPNAN